MEERTDLLELEATELLPTTNAVNDDLVNFGKTVGTFVLANLITKGIIKAGKAIGGWLKKRKEAKAAKEESKEEPKKVTDLFEDDGEPIE